MTACAMQRAFVIRSLNGMSGKPASRLAEAANRLRA
jgi:phosphotransferase system HPr-like phosphotransfer protein